ncbi:lipocalin-like domain-containing protein [Mesorhizobium sp.]|uniref:lipocalin-like domain-containing protein n=1 Tax=Mesorhizobium sp. TaxID=1871066 RepID=UPI0025E12008|nr:lipocalin-like domain-containing protein [Mesorhizobium sp.]
MANLNNILSGGKRPDRFRYDFFPSSSLDFLPTVSIGSVAWIDAWQMEGDSLDRLQLSATGNDFAYDIAMHAEGPLVFHGAGGYSVKSAKGQASYYYSQPFFSVEGKISLPEGEIRVRGTAWLDREWSSQPLADDQNGWDWFSLSFDTGEKLMGFPPARCR